MSQAQQIQLEADDESSVFGQVVEDDPGVCDNCFRRTHQVEENWHPSQGDLLKKGYDASYYEMPAEQRERKFTYRRFHPIEENVEKAYAPRREKPHGSPKGRNICKECGIIDSGQKFRPISKDEAIQYTQHLTARLEETPLSFDEDVLFRCVRHLKSRPDHQSADDAIFEAAVRIAIKYGDPDDDSTQSS